MTATDSEALACAARLRGAASLLSRRMRPNPLQGGIGAAKLSVVGQLYRVGPMTPTDIAQREGVKLQSLTRLLAELESEGWIARKADPADGRRSLLSLTAFGTRRLALAVRGGEQALAEVVAERLTAEERALLVQACGLIDRLVEGLDESARGAP